VKRLPVLRASVQAFFSEFVSAAVGFCRSPPRAFPLSGSCRRGGVARRLLGFTLAAMLHVEVDMADGEATRLAEAALTRIHDLGDVATAISMGQ
jgi:hypothetical protein